MDSAQHARFVSFLWGVADDLLRDVYVRGKYRDVILPMTLIRRLDAMIEPTRGEVNLTAAMLTRQGLTAEQQARPLLKAAKQSFYNTSTFTLKGLLSRPNTLADDFTAYLRGFSPNVREVIERFGFLKEVSKLDENKALHAVIERFVDDTINFAPVAVTRTNARGETVEVLPALTNADMGVVFEELLRRFAEDNNAQAGEHFTPREVVRLMTRLVVMPVADQLADSTYLLYDCACGTGGMLSEADTTLKQVAADHGKHQLRTHLYGQEVNDETYAICKADMILKGEREDNIRRGSTLADDAFPRMQFDFMLANPPYGKSWKNDLQALCDGEKSEMKDPRFVVNFGGRGDFNLVTRSSDGQLMFLANMLAKMKHDTPQGSRIATIHNGSALFTGSAGQGESNLRRYVLENDWLEAIVALPLNLFYNTGIATYVWVVSNRKPRHRRGKVQLIDASAWSRPLRKNLGSKNCELGPDDLDRIVQTFRDFEENEHSRIFPNDAFGYQQVTVERPLRLRVALDAAARAAFRTACSEAGEATLADVVDALHGRLGDGPHTDYNSFLAAFEAEAEARKVKCGARQTKLLATALAVRDPAAEPVLRRVFKPGKEKADPLHGRFERSVGGRRMVVEYEPDAELRDSEQVPLREEGGVAAFLAREVHPYAPDAWVNKDATATGYEISFNRYFYKPKALRSLAEIGADLRAVERESEGLLADILALGGVA